MIKLIKCVDYIGQLFFSNFGVRHVASQRFFHGKQHVCVLLDHIVIFLAFFGVKKTRNVIWRRMVHTRARDLPYLTFGAILDNVGTKTTPA